MISLAEQLRSAVALHNRGQLSQAQAIYKKVLRTNPAHADAMHLLGIIAYQQRQYAKAVELIGRAIGFSPGRRDFYVNRGLAFQELNDLDAAVADFDKAISIRPDSAAAYSNRGNALKKLRKFDAALDDFNHAISLKPDFAEAYNNRGITLRALSKLDSALADFNKAISIRPGYAEAHNNRGGTLRELKRPDAAVADFSKAISLRADYVDAYSNRGLVLQELKRLDAALADFDNAISIKPDYAEACLYKAFTLLLRGDFETGFKLYEARWKLPTLKMRRQYVQRLWHGEELLRDKKILLHSEQGLGDTIQFCRYSSLLAQAGAEVILEVPAPLVGLLKTLNGVSQVLPMGEPLPEFDYHCPLMSLPLAFKTVLGTIPCPIPYLHPDPLKVRDWQERIAQRGLGEQKRLKVGVVWNGGFRPNQPEVWAVNESRNIPLAMFARELNHVDADFISLQKGEPAESEIRSRESEYWHRGNLHNFTDEIKDFSDTAALIANLDLVVSVDTSTAHLSAALGKRTWILNRFDTCWRWLLDRDDSPWYPSVTLYRQDESQRWEPVLRRVAADLTKLANELRPGCGRKLVEDAP
jgi:tetratricopeptide (TPR) repeat protein